MDTIYYIRQQLAMGIPLTHMDLRTTDYTRVSTEHLEQMKSLKNQVEHFEEYIKSNERWTYVPGYSDEGITGTSDIKRENFMRMINDAKEGKFDLIITKEISRFSRNTLDSIKYTRELLACGVAVWFVNDNINTALPDSELRLTIMASMAQDEIRRLSGRVKFGMDRAITNGEILGNNLFYGYNKNKETGNLEIIQEEAEVVIRLFKMYGIENISLSKIANVFNNEEIKTCQNKKWCTSTLSRMLANPKYKGYYCGKKSEITDYLTKKVKYFEEKDWVMYKNTERIPPIITEELWERANTRLKSRKRKFGEGFKDKVMYQNRYPLSAKIYCAEHNTLFHRRKQLKASNDITWSCSEYLIKGKKACNSPNIRESELNNIFTDIFNEVSINLNNVSSILCDLYNNNQTQSGFDEKLQKLNIDKERINQKKDKILELNIEGNLSNHEFCDKNNIYNKELKEISFKISELENKRKSFNSIKDKNERLEKILSTKVKSKNIKDKLLDLLLDRIVVSKIENDQYNIDLKIFLNFSNDNMNNNTISVNPKVEGLKNLFRKDYSFNRGYETKGTKRYTVKYQVDCYICI